MLAHTVELLAQAASLISNNNPETAQAKPYRTASENIKQ